MPALKATQLLRILKSAYGLAEAPRLWYLRACELMAAAGWQELGVCRVTYQAIDPEGSLPCGMQCLHVTDGARGWQ